MTTIHRLCYGWNPIKRGSWRRRGRKKGKSKHDTSLALTAYFPLLPKEENDSRSLYSPHGCSSERQGMAWSRSQLLAWAQPGFSKTVLFFFLPMSRRSLIAMNVVWDPVWFPWFFRVTHLIPLCTSRKREKHSLCSMRGLVSDSVELHALKEAGLYDQWVMQILFSSFPPRM